MATRRIVSIPSPNGDFASKYVCVYGCMFMYVCVCVYVRVCVCALCVYVLGVCFDIYILFLLYSISQNNLKEYQELQLIAGIQTYTIR